MTQLPLLSLFFVYFFSHYTLLVSGAAIPPSIQPQPHLQPRDQAAQSKPPLRILPLGASITWGLRSSTGNGYREPLQERLRYDDWEVLMVGSKHHGNMIDNNVEARSGHTINQVKAAASNSLAYKPNVILIEAGANDCRLGIDIPNAGKRMRSLIRKLVDSPGMKDSLVVLSTLLPSGNKKILAHSQNVNQQFRDLVVDMRKNHGVSVVLAEMNPDQDLAAHSHSDSGSGSGSSSSPGLALDQSQSALSWPGDFVTKGVTDSTHPNDRGYEKMASVWYQAIVGAAAQNMIPAPVEMGCDAENGDGL